MGPALVVASAAGLTAVGAIARGEAPKPRVFLGAAIAGAGFLLLAQYSPDVSAKLAGVVLMTALLTSGYDVATGVTRALNR
jgi:hypothetical protein